MPFRKPNLVTLDFLKEILDFAFSIQKFRYEVGNNPFYEETNKPTYEQTINIWILQVLGKISLILAKKINNRKSENTPGPPDPSILEVEFWDLYFQTWHILGNFFVNVSFFFKSCS